MPFSVADVPIWTKPRRIIDSSAIIKLCPGSSTNSSGGLSRVNLKEFFLSTFTRFAVVIEFSEELLF